MKTIGILFGESILWENSPFRKKTNNDAFQLFSEIGKQKGIRFLISTFKQLDGKTLKKAWVFENSWQVIENTEIELIFDRSETNCKNDEKKEELNKRLRLINSPGLNKLCWDKMQTYDYFSELVPRTFAVNSIDELKEILPLISTDKVVLMPRYKIKNIEIIKKKKIKEIKKRYVVQKFIDSAGIKELNISEACKLRIVIINGEIHHSYAKLAGKKVFVEKEKIPERIIELAKEVDLRLEKYNPRIYAIDFVYDKEGKIWISELKSIPGFVYEDNESLRKDFIEKIVDILKDAEPAKEIEDEPEKEEPEEKIEILKIDRLEEIRKAREEKELKEKQIQEQKQNNAEEQRKEAEEKLEGETEKSEQEPEES